MEARHGVLKAVREQLGSVVQEGGAWRPEQWWEAFSFLFTEQAEGAAHLKHNDDLLFFVHVTPAHALAGRAPASKHGDPNGSGGLDQGPFSVRRRVKQLAPEWCISGSLFSAIAWDKTLLLNIVLQTAFVLTVVVCRCAVLHSISLSSDSH